MRFSIWPAPGRPWEEILELALHCEATGWDGIYFPDHFMPNAPDATPLDGDVLECWTVLAALAATVPRLRLAPLVTSVTYRHPAVLANIAAAVDRVSNGRLLLGIGAGWQENEHAAYGIALGSVKERLDRFEEACAIITSLLREPRTTVAGRHFHVADAPNQPVPVQSPLPLLIGGGGEKRTLRIAAQYADEWNTWGLPDHLSQKIGVLDAHCERLGRDPSQIGRSAQALIYLGDDPDWLAERKARAVGFPAIVGNANEVQDVMGHYKDAGLTEFIIPAFNLGPPDRAAEALQRFSEEVAVAFG